ncbi:MAG: bifunctional DNA primase/polymerase [Gemmataceae bacterium]
MHSTLRAMNKMEATNVDAALEYLAMGWTVIPLCPHDDSGDSSSHTQTCTRPGKVAMVRFKPFQAQHPSTYQLTSTFETNSNVGIVMGQLSGLVGLDIDGPKAWDWYFEVMIFGEGTYTVAPPSVHPSGQTYGPWEGKLTDSPGWILEFV